MGEVGVIGSFKKPKAGVLPLRHSIGVHDKFFRPVLPTWSLHISGRWQIT
jgi:hypothetical protein